MKGLKKYYSIRDIEISGDTGQRVFSALYEEVKDSESILEVGCGSGMLSLMLKEEGFKVKAIDNNKVAVEMTKAKGIVVKAGDMEDIPYKENFDIIVGQHILEESKNYQKTIDNLLEHCSKVVIISTADKDKLKKLGNIKLVLKYIYRAKTYKVYMLIVEKTKEAK